MNISYAITTHNEGHSIRNLLVLLNSFLRESDELIVLDDYSTDQTTVDILHGCKNVYTRRFDNNFSEHKNYLNSLCSKDYIFQFDGDELPTIHLLKFIQSMVQLKKDVDLYWIPRDNKLYDLDMEYIKKINWRLDEKRRINYPDYQGRCFRRVDSINWIRPVHEVISGHTSQMVLPKNSGLDIMHHRHMSHQVRSNLFYDKTFK
jgi:glycosyltransferase involved in cell wall biosynthesis